MKILRDSDRDNVPNLGGKAKNLFRLEEMGFAVPKFVVIPADMVEETSSSKNDLAQILSALTTTAHFAVRSSAIDEDGAKHSFAGQFESFLFVKPKNLAEKIKAVWQSAHSPRVAEYRRHHGLSPQTQIAVIVQEMIDADVSGVAFGANPVNGRAEEKVINAVFGLGEGLVSGTLDADQFVIKDGKITTQLAAKTQQVSLDKKQQNGTKLTDVPPDKQNLAALSEGQIWQLAEVLDTLQAEFGQPQDIEFAYQNGELFLLQTRPITSLGPNEDEKKGAYVLWDNSNIIESYPGVTTPLTFSFITTSYEGAYSQFSAYLGVSEKVIAENRRVFANTLGLLDGRVYYNLKTWYHMLAMLPGYSLNARYMEKMMGVKARFDVPEKYRLSKGKAWWSIARMAAKLLTRFLALPQKRREFMALVEKTIGRYQAIDLAQKDAHELMDLYLDFEKTLLDEWKAPLLNDFFAMIWFGMLQKQGEKHFGGTHPNIHNDLLCGSSDIISVEPVHRSIGLASRVAANPALKKLFLEQEEKSVLRELRKNPDYATFNLDLEKYLSDFGERCVGELKLETISYAQEPARFVRVLKSYVASGVTEQLFSDAFENEVRQSAEREVKRVLGGKFLTKWWFGVVLKNARSLVSARENLRYERTRAFGVVRQLFTELGKRFCQAQILPEDRAIFYLSKEEIFAYLEGRSVNNDLAALVALRQQEFDSYRKAEAPPERFATYGAPYHRNGFYGKTQLATPESTDNESPARELRGIGCSPGRVRGRVRVVLDPAEVSSLDGDILVTHSTDPGWVMLFPAAGGIIVERGSLLSHSAIISREMGKPCIVGVTGLLTTLKTGDEIEMDGGTGLIKIVTP